MFKGLNRTVSNWIQNDERFIPYALGAIALLIIILLVAFAGPAKAADVDNFVAVSQPRVVNGNQIQFMLTSLQFPDKCKNGMVAIATTRRGETEPDTLSIGCWASSNEGVLLWDFNKSPADGATIPKTLFTPVRRKPETSV